MSDEVETYYENGAWRNWARGEDIGRPHESRSEAVAEGREAAIERRVEHVLRDEHATVVDRRSYG